MKHIISDMMELSVRSCLFNIYGKSPWCLCFVIVCFLPWERLQDRSVYLINSKRDKRERKKKEKKEAIEEMTDYSSYSISDNRK